MAAEPFRFQQFVLEQEGVGHKVGEDSILLGGWTEWGNPQTVLDVGTGTGILALIAAQFTSAQIVALDSDPAAVQRATRNAAHSIWNDRIQVMEQDILALEAEPFDHIVTNPPYFGSGPLSPQSQRSEARHMDADLGRWMNAFAKLSHLHSQLTLVFPATRRLELMQQALAHGWHRKRECWVLPLQTSPAQRIMVTFTRIPTLAVSIETVVVRNADGSYHSDFKQYTHDLYRD